VQSKIFFQKCEVEILIKQMTNLQLASERIGAEHVSLVNIHRCFTSIVSIPNAKSISLDKNAAKEEPSPDNIYIASQNGSKKTHVFFVQAIWLLQTILVYKNTDKPNKCSFYSVYVMQQFIKSTYHTRSHRGFILCYSVIPLFIFY